MTLKHMSLEEFLDLAQTMPRLMIYREMMADRLTPVGVVEQLEAEMQEGTLLESGMQQSEDGRYSYIAFGQMAQLSAYGTQITQRVGTKITQTVADPFAVLRQMVAELVVSPTHELLRRHGAVGFVTYDAVRISENIPDRHRSEQELPDLLFHFYHTALIFDHAQHKLLLAKMVDFGTDDLIQVYQDTQIYLQNLIQKITRSTSLKERSVSEKVSVLAPEVDVSDAQFMQLIAQAKHHILFTYLNPIFRFLQTDFFQKAQQAGIDGLLVVDCPLEEMTPLLQPCAQHGLAPIFVATPSTPNQRIQQLDQLGQGFLYYACRKGTTGVRAQLPEDFTTKIQALKAYATLPLVVGFGIASREAASQVLDDADGVVVGSLFVEALEKGMSFKDLQRLAMQINPLVRRV